MIPKIQDTFNLPKTILISFKELDIFKSLKKATIYKRNGHHVNTIFMIVFSLVFHHQSWNQLKNSKLGASLPSKDAIYRFLSHQHFNWRRFLSSISFKCVDIINSLTNHHRVNVFIVDDSPYNRSRSKKIEMLSTIFDHASKSFFNGFHLLTLGFSDGATFIPLDFSFVSTIKSMIHPMTSSLDKRTIAYQRRKDCLSKKTELAVEMIKRTLNHGVYAPYVLMDSWFSSSRMFHDIHELGMDMIGMLKRTPKQFFKVEGKTITIKSLFSLSMKSNRKEMNGSGILSRMTVTTMNGIPLQIVFVMNRNKKSDWLAIASSDLSITDEEVIRIYEYRWSIEVFFKSIKSTFRLEKEFQVNSFDAIIAHTTIVFTRYIIVTYQVRQDQDIKTLGELFRLLCDDIKEISFIEALNTLIMLIEELKDVSTTNTKRRIDQLMEQWVDQLPLWLADLLMLSRTVS